MIAKVHGTGKKIVAICDSDLLGKKFEQGNLQLDLTSKFYNGSEIAEENLLDLIREAYIINAVGDETISFLLRNNVIEDADIRQIDNISYANVLFA